MPEFERNIPRHIELSKDSLTGEELKTAAIELDNLLRHQFEGSEIKRHGAKSIALSKVKEEYRQSAEAGKEPDLQRLQTSDYRLLKRDGQQSWAVDFSEERTSKLCRWTIKSIGSQDQLSYVQENLEVIAITTGENAGVRYSYEIQKKDQKPQTVTLQNTPRVIQRAREIIGDIPQTRATPGEQHPKPL